MNPAVGLRLPAARKQAHVVLFAGNKFSGYMELSKGSSNASNQILPRFFLSLGKMTMQLNFCL